MSERLFIVFDTETTGLERVSEDNLFRPASITQRGAEILQIGGLILNNKMEPMELFCHYCDTVTAEGSREATAVHGISIREVRSLISGQFLPEVMQRYLPEFFYPDVVFIGYNVKFDIAMVKQTLANSSLSFNCDIIKGAVVPKRGRYMIDVADYVRTAKAYRRLSSFEKDLVELRANFMANYKDIFSIETNCLPLLEASWNQAHNSFFDALNTFLLWGDRIWMKKLL